MLIGMVNSNQRFEQTLILQNDGNYLPVDMAFTSWET